MNRKLLIIGAGGHGEVVAEVAADCGYSDIAFIDDNSEKAIGTISDLSKFQGEYVDAFVGIGNNKLRGQLLEKIKDIGFNVPVLIHPSAYISRSCKMQKGVIVEPKAIVNAHSIIGEGSIVSVGAIVDHDALIGKCCHINSGAVVKAGAKICDYRKLEAGEVILGYESARVR